MAFNKLNFALIGCGYWGPNFLRIIRNSESAFLSKVCDISSARLAVLTTEHPGVVFTDKLEDIVTDPNIDAVVVCTPADTHFNITKELLINGKHVLCEKPLANSEEHCKELHRLSLQKGKQLLAGHVFEYNSVVGHIKKLIVDNELGDILYMQLWRMGLGPSRIDANVVFDLASHDVSIAMTLMDAMPIAVTANGACFVRKQLEDVAFIQMEFPRNIFANVNVSWIDPVKERTVKVVGSKKMVLFDDISLTGKLKIIEMGKWFQSNTGDLGDVPLSVKDGEVVIPHVQESEPLITEFDHFIACIRGQEQPKTDAVYAGRVIKILEAVQTSIRNHGQKVTLQ